MNNHQYHTEDKNQDDANAKDKGADTTDKAEDNQDDDAKDEEEDKQDEDDKDEEDLLIARLRARDSLRRTQEQHPPRNHWMMIPYKVSMQSNADPPNQSQLTQIPSSQ